MITGTEFPATTSANTQTTLFATVRGAWVAVVVFALAACAAPGDASPESPSPPTVSESPPPSTSAPPEEPPQTQEPPADQPALLPTELLGLWVSLNQGSAETIYRLSRDGTYDRASVLLQERASGTFSLSIQMSGFATVAGNELTLTPTEGKESMQDPDAPSSNYDRAITDLTPEVYVWAMDGGTLYLTGEYGTVAYASTSEE